MPRIGYATDAAHSNDGDQWDEFRFSLRLDLASGQQHRTVDGEWGRGQFARPQLRAMSTPKNAR